MTTDYPVVNDELEHLDRVLNLLIENPQQVAPSEKPLVEELLRLREELPRAKEEDKGSLLMQYDQAHGLLLQLRKTRERTPVDMECPYFAHVCLEEKGKQRHVFLGKATRIDNGLRIVDWRNAPISKIFYRYQQGEEYEEMLGGRDVEGKVIARRTVTIDREGLQRIDAPEGTFTVSESGWEQREREAARLAGGQGTALRAHAKGEGADRRLGTDMQGSRRRTDKRLPDIAGLIDAEQIELITRPRTGFVVIRGTAGSGKTTVALHRIAWMAYEDPSFDSPRTLFLVFSKALKDYVSHVLPALGVTRAAVMDFRSWSHKARLRHFPRIPKHVRDTTPAVVVRLKQHPAMLDVLREQVLRFDAKPSPEQAMDDWISSITSLELLREIFGRVDPGAFSDAELAKATSWCHDRTTELLAMLDGEEVEGAIDIEDEPLLLRAWQLRVGPLRGRKKAPLRYKHLAIDEVQDFSPTEVRVLLDCLDKHKSITLAGDTQQHVMKESGFTSWTDFFRHLGVEGTAVDTLKISYRSAAPIVTFAMKLLGPLREDDSMPLVTRTGPPVEMFQFTDHGAAVAFLADALKDLVRAEPMASVVLLTPDANTSGIYSVGLKSGEVPRLRRITHQDFTFAPGVEITELDQIKGLEFDYVVLIDPNARHFSDTPAARRLLHVGATRAVHQLWVVCVGTPSPILTEALEP